MSLNIFSLREYLSERIGLQKIVANFSWLLAGKLLRYAIGLFISVWTARYLKPELFGVLNYCIAFVGFFVGIASLGTPQILIRQFVKKPNDSNKILGSGIILMALGGLISTIFCLTLIYVLKGDDELTLILVMILSVRLLIMPYRVIWCYFESILRSKIQVISSMVSYILISGGRIVALIMGLSVKVFAILIVSELVLTAIFMSYYFLKFTDVGRRIKSIDFDLQTSKTILKDSYPLIFSIAATSLLLRVDQIMVRDMCDDKAAGIYAAAVRLTELWYFLPVILQSSVFPSIVSSLGNTKQFNLKIVKLFRLVIILGIAIALPISMFSNPIVLILYGQNYADSGLVLSILIWAVLFIGINQIRNSYLYARNYTAIHFKIVLLSLLVNIFSNYFLIPKFGAEGAAISTLVAYGFGSLFANFIFSDTKFLTTLILKSITNFKLT